MNDLLFLGFLLVQEGIFEFLDRQHVHAALFDLSVNVLELVILVLWEQDEIDELLKLLRLLAIHLVDVVPDRHAIQDGLCANVHLIIVIDEVSQLFQLVFGHHAQELEQGQLVLLEDPQDANYFLIVLLLKSILINIFAFIPIDNLVPDPVLNFLGDFFICYSMDLCKVFDWWWIEIVDADINVHFCCFQFFDYIETKYSLNSISCSLIVQVFNWALHPLQINHTLAENPQLVSLADGIQDKA